MHAGRWQPPTREHVAESYGGLIEAPILGTPIDHGSPCHLIIDPRPTSRVHIREVASDERFNIKTQLHAHPLHLFSKLQRAAGGQSRDSTGECNWVGLTPAVHMTKRSGGHRRTCYSGRSRISWRSTLWGSAGAFCRTGRGRDRYRPFRVQFRASLNWVVLVRSKLTEPHLNHASHVLQCFCFHVLCGSYMMLQGGGAIHFSELWGRREQMMHLNHSKGIELIDANWCARCSQWFLRCCLLTYTNSTVF